jgi:hypothetical protein
MDLIKMYPCVASDTDGTYPIVPYNVFGASLDMITSGDKSNEQNKVLRKRTGITAFSLTDFFLQIS